MVPLNLLTFFLTALVLPPLASVACSRATTKGLTLAGSTSRAALRGEMGRRLPRPTTGVADSRAGRRLDRRRPGRHLGRRADRHVVSRAHGGRSPPEHGDHRGARRHRDRGSPRATRSAICWLEQLRDIYAGENRSWDGLGGRKQSITVITREDGSGTAIGLRDTGDGRKPDRGFGAGPGLDRRGAPDGRGDPAAIGYVSLGLVDASVKALKLRRRRRERGHHRRRDLPAGPSVPLRLSPASAGRRARATSSTGSPAPRGATSRAAKGLLPPGT